MARKTRILILFMLIIIGFSSLINAEIIKESNKNYVKIDLEEKWNLVAGISFSDELHEDSDLSLNHLISAYYHDSKNNKDIEIRPIYSAGDIDPLELYGKAFWIYSAGKGEIIYKVSPSFIDKSKGNQKQMYEGWNSIAINDQIYDKEWGEIEGDCNIVDARFWNATSQKWMKLDLTKEFNISSKKEIVGKGINIKVKENCKILSSNGGNGGNGNSGSPGTGGGSDNVINYSSSENYSSIEAPYDVNEEIGKDSEEERGFAEGKEKDYDNLFYYLLIGLSILILLIFGIIMYKMFRSSKKHNKIYNEIRNANYYLEKGEISKAKESYNKIRKLYPVLPSKKKERIYPSIIKIYKKLY